MKILHSADWHIALDKNKIPNSWQINRFRQFFREIQKLEKTHDIHIIAGDIFDTAPTLDEVNLFAEFCNYVSIRTIIIPGNHEATKKGKTFLESYNTLDNAINNDLIEIYCDNTRIEHEGVNFQLFPYGKMQLDKMPTPVEGDILVTHIRGEVPPHIKPEYDFEKLRPWKLILLGDLHFNHQYQDYPAYYSGSPMNVSFDRTEDRKYGVNTIDFKSIDNYTVEMLPLDLPRLLRKKIATGTKLEEHPIHRVIYEVEGNSTELDKMKDNDLIDKKIRYKPKEDSKLDLRGLNEIEELKKYLVLMGYEEQLDDIIKEYQDMSINV